jgi:agmatinase
MRRCYELLGDEKIFQFGIRSGDREEFRFAKEGHVTMQRFCLEGLKQIIEQLKDKPVYVTVDLDVLDPSIFPGTGTPEAGGVSFLELLNALRAVGTRCHVVACDVNELSPIYDQSGVSTAVAGKLIREFLLALC